MPNLKKIEVPLESVANPEKFGTLAIFYKEMYDKGIY